MPHHEAFLVDPDGGADHLGRQPQERLIKTAHQGDRPLHQPRDLVEQGRVLDQFQPLREGEMPGISQNNILAPRRVEHDLGLLQFRGVILEMPDMEFSRRQEAVPVRGIARRDAVDRKRHDVGLLGLRAEGGHDGMQRPHPGQRARACRPLAPAHRLRPREGADDERKDFRQHVDGGAPRLLDQRHIEVAPLGVLLDGRLGKRGEAGAFEEALHRGVGSADPRPFALLLEIALARRNALHGEREPPRRRERRRPLIDEPGIDQPIGDHAAQILRRLRLHAGGDFLGKQLEQ